MLFRQEFQFRLLKNVRAKRAKVSERSELRRIGWHTYKRIWWHTYKRIWWHTYKRIWWHTYKRIWCLKGATPDTHINAFGAWHTDKRGPWKNCQKYALKLFKNACTWHVLEDLTFYGQWTKLYDRSKNGPKPGQGDGGHQGVGLTGGGGPARVPNLRVCTHLWSMGGTRRGRRMNQHPAVVPSSRRGNTSSESQRRENGAARKGKWSPCAGNRQSSLVTAQASRVSVAARGCARVTSKAGKNGQHSAEVGGSSPRTRPSAPECGDTLKAQAGDQGPIWGGDRCRRRLRGRIDGVTGRSYSSARRRLNVQSGQRKGRKVCCGPPPERCRPWSWTLKRCCGKRMGPLKGASRKRSGELVRSPKITRGDKRLSRLISNIHHTCGCKKKCRVGNTAKQCRLGLFQDSDFAGDLEDSKLTSGGTLCIFGSHTFVPISWMCKRHTSVSHNSTESEIISLDAGLRLDGIPALDLWDLISVSGNTTQTTERPGRHWQESEISREDQRVEQHSLCFLQRPVFAPRSFVVGVRGQRSSDQNHWRKDSHNETCFQDPQSCTWLVVRSN